MDQNNMFDNQPDTADSGTQTSDSTPEGYTAPDIDSPSYGYSSASSDNTGNNTSGYNTDSTSDSGQYKAAGNGYAPSNSNNYTSSSGNGHTAPGGNGDIPGRGAATASLVLGIISIASWFFGIGAFVGIITGIIGLICSSNAKREGYTGGMQTGGFVCSLIGLIGGALVLVACVACVGFIGTVGALSEF